MRKDAGALRSWLIAYYRNDQAVVYLEGKAMLRQIKEIPCSYKTLPPRMASNPTHSATTKGLSALAGSICASKTVRTSTVIPCSTTPVMRQSRSDHGKYWTPGRSITAETTETSTPLSMMTMEAGPPSEARARVSAGGGLAGGSRGVDSTSPPQEVDPCCVSSASRFTTITLAPSRAGPCTTDLPGLLVICIAA